MYSNVTKMNSVWALRSHLSKSVDCIKEQAQSIGELSASPNFYMEKAYTKAINKAIKKLAVDSAFLASLNNKNKVNAGALCDALDYKPLDRLYY